MATLWEKIETFEAFQKKNQLPELPGVYFFLDRKKRLLYIGKATSLRNRVKSYFLSDISETRGPKIERMLGKIGFVAYRKTDSVLEALILEAKLIKEHQPLYNTDAKDDKSYNHVVITKEKFPRVFIVRGRDIEQKKFTDPVKYIFGPFPSGGALREAIKIVRKLFPFRDKCKPFEALNDIQKKKAGPCFSSQIGLCPGVCVAAISAREYARTIHHIRLFFEGRKKMLIKKLGREMKEAAKHLAFERANEIKKTLFSLKHIKDMALIKDDAREVTMHRIEAYDVAHLSGKASVGVVVVVRKGEPEKESYKKFILRGNHNGDDVRALEEIVCRRLKHAPPATVRKRSVAIRADEWPLPEIIVVDGAKPQVEAVERVLTSFGVTIPVIGVVKNAQHRPERLLGSEELIRRFKKDVLLANSEAHRFAITFHRKRLGKEFLSR